MFTGGTGTQVRTIAELTGTAEVDNSSVGQAEELQQEFLKLLLTQLENQNPLDPVDPSEYTAQLVQYSSLEQQISSNVKLDQLLASLQVSTNLNAFSYIDNRVQMETPMTVMQDSNADWQYALASDAEKVEVKVKDSEGRVVYKETLGRTEAGSYQISFDAEDALYPVADGDVLTLSIDAVDKEGKTVQYGVMTEVVIDGVETTEDGITLRAGKLVFDTDDISRVLGPKPAEVAEEDDDTDTPAPTA
jgi:flagellar basal-body rod modification protein FlgD